MYKVKRFSQMTEQKEFGAVKAANKAAKKAWEQGMINPEYYHLRNTSRVRNVIRNRPSSGLNLVDKSMKDRVHLLENKELYQGGYSPENVKALMKAYR